MNKYEVTLLAYSAPDAPESISVEAASFWVEDKCFVFFSEGQCECVAAFPVSEVRSVIRK